jgi:hypothetical protein
MTDLANERDIQNGNNIGKSSKGKKSSGSL